MAIGLNPLARPTARCAPPSADIARHLLVRRRLAVGNLQQSFPDNVLEFGPLHGQSNVEVGQRAVKVPLGFVGKLLKVRIGIGYGGTTQSFAQIRDLHFQGAPIGELEQADALIRCSRDEGPGRRIHPLHVQALRCTAPPRCLSKETLECLTALPGSTARSRILSPPLSNSNLKLS